jgi:arabinofuranosyltransferase
MPNSISELKSWLFWLILVCGVFLFWTWLFQGLIYDDAYIAFRFSDNWASGIGLTWNAGERVVEGFTSFLWVVIGAAIKFLTGIPPHKSMVFIGIMSWLALAAIVAPLISKLLAPDQINFFSRVPRAVCILAILVTPQVALGAFQGLETALFSFILALIVLFALKADAPWMKGFLVICSIASFMTRPDALAFILPLWAILLVFANGSDRRTYLKAFCVMLFILLLYFIFKWQWSGYPFPNTYYIKKGSGLEGRGYVSEYLRAFTPVWLFIAYVVGRIGSKKLLRDRSLLLLIVPSFIFCVSYMAIIPTMGRAFRFLIPTWPIFVLAVLRVETLRSEQKRSSEAEPTVIGVGPVFCLTLAVLTINSWRLMKGQYQDISRLCKFTIRANVAGGKLISPAAELTPAPVLATGDIGALPYFSKLKTIDLIGLADTTIAHQGLTHEYFNNNHPDIVVLQDLFLRYCPPPLHASNIELTVNSMRCWLDVEQYSWALTEPSESHNGAGSTFQVVTSPGFNDLYVHVGRLPSEDGYHVFLRKDYKHFDKLTSLFSSILSNHI